MNKRTHGLPTLKDILYIFFKNINLISVVFLSALIGSVIYCTIATPLYKAETKIIVKMGKAQISGMEQYNAEKFNIVYQERSANLRNELEMIKGQFMAEKVLVRMSNQIEEELSRKSLITKIKYRIFDLIGKKKSKINKKSVVDQLIGGLEVEAIEDTDMLRLSFTWDDPVFAAAVANNYASEYMAQHASVYESNQTYRFYMDQIELSSRQLKQAESELQEFIDKNRISNIAVQKDLLLKRIDDLENSYLTSSVEYDQSLIKLKRVQEMAQRNSGWIETPELGASVSDKLGYIKTIDENFFRLQLERARLLKNFTPKAQEIQSIDTQMAALRMQKVGSLTNLIQTEMDLAQTKKASLARELIEGRKRHDEINAQTTRLRQLERAKEISEANFLVYKKKAEELRISDDLDVKKISSVKIANPAIPPLESAYPRSGLIIGLAAFLGLFFAFAISAFREFFNHTFRDDDDVMAMIEVPLLLSFPLIVDQGQKKPDEWIIATLWKEGQKRIKEELVKREKSLVLRFLKKRKVYVITAFVLIIAAIYGYNFFSDETTTTSNSSIVETGIKEKTESRNPASYTPAQITTSSEGSGEASDTVKEKRDVVVESKNAAKGKKEDIPIPMEKKGIGENQKGTNSK